MNLSRTWNLASYSAIVTFLCSKARNSIFFFPIRHREVLVIEDIAKFLSSYLLGTVAPQRKTKNIPLLDPSLSSNRSTCDSYSQLLRASHMLKHHLRVIKPQMCRLWICASSEETASIFEKGSMSHFGVGWETCSWHPELSPCSKCLGLTSLPSSLPCLGAGVPIVVKLCGWIVGPPSIPGDGDWILY